MSIDEVEVSGGHLAVHVLADAPSGAPAAVALHGISSNARSWAPVARAVAGRLRVLAPDLRGRAGSSALRSTGLADHVADVLRLLDHYELERPVLAGHSIGAFVAALTAATHPDRVAGVVLVDGGLAFPSPGTFEVDEVLHSVVGPAVDRLSTSSLESVRADWSDLMSDPATLSAVHTLQCPGHLLWAERGLLGQAEGWYTREWIDRARLPDDIEVTSLPSDHDGALLEPASVQRVAEAVAGLAGVPTSGQGIHSSGR